MPFQQMVEEFNRRSRYQINSEAIQTYVELAMIHEDEDRDNALFS